MKKRILLILLVCAMILPIVACTGSDEPNVTTPAENDVTSNENTGDVTTDAVTTLVESDVNVDLGNAKVSILYWSDVERPEFDVPELTSDRVKDAIFNRNAAVEERLNVNLEWVGTPGNYQNQAAFVKECEKGNTDGLYDVFAGYSLSAATIAMNGLSQNMLDLDYLDFDKPWWPESLTSQATVNGKLYFASGDISTMMLHMMYGVLFNKDILKNLGYEGEEPYTLVQNKKWTIKEMMKMCENAYEDLEGTPAGKDELDQFGFICTDINFDGFYTCAGLKTIEATDDGLIISPDLTSEKAQNLVEMVVGLFNQPYALGKASGGWATLAFGQNRALFTMDRVYITSSVNILPVIAELQYGVVPCPMYDTKQANYVTMLGFPYTLYSISSASKNANNAAAVLEVLGYEGYRQVTPELFETVMKVRYTSDETAAEMYDLIKACVYIDHGRLFTTPLQNITYNVFRSEIKAGSTAFQSKINRNLGTLEVGLKQINDKFYGD